MIFSEKQENSDVIQESIDYLERLGFENIQADIEGYETPKSYKKKGSDITITPDIVAEKAGRLHYFDISLKSNNPELLKSKWRFLDVLTRMYDHRFRIITKHGHYNFTDELLNELNIKKNLIKLN